MNEIKTSKDKKIVFQKIREYVQNILGNNVSSYILQYLTGVNERNEPCIKLQLNSLNHYETVLSAARQTTTSGESSWKEVS